MVRLFLLRLLISLFVIACFAAVLWPVILALEGDPGAMRPFRIEQQGTALVLHAQDEVPLPAPLGDGQVIDLKAMSVLERADLLYTQRAQPGAPVTLAVLQNGLRRRLTVDAVSSPPEKPLERFQNWMSILDLSFVLAVALLTLWRGREGSAWWLCVFAVGVLFTDGARNMMTGPVAGLVLTPMMALAVPVYLVALYGMAVSVAGAGLSPQWRRVGRCVVACVALAGAAGILGASTLPVYAGVNLARWLQRVCSALILLVPLVAVLTLLVGYLRAVPERRGRMRWVLASTTLLLISVLLLSVLTPERQPVLFAFVNAVLTGLSLFGYLYGILRNRVVDVTFVIDRALVYSIMTAMLFGTFSLLEDAVHRLALGEQLGWVVQAGGAAGVAALLSPLHRLLDRGLERVFFHKLRAMAGALRRMARDSAFFETEEALLARVITQLRVPCAAAAIYARNGAIYQRRAADGEGWPDALDADDPLFVRLRRDHQMLDLRGQDSTAGADGLAFPMTVGQLLTGAVVCRLREGEQLDSEVRAALAELTHSLGTSIYLLRYRELARLTADLASGHLDQAAARTRAAALAVAL